MSERRKQDTAAATDGREVSDDTPKDGSAEAQNPAAPKSKAAQKSASKAGKGGKSKKSPAGPAPKTPQRDEADLFINEVTEELQKERAYAAFRRYGPIAGAVIVAIVLGAAVNEYLKSAATESARAAGARLAEAAAARVDAPLQAADAFAAAAEAIDGDAAVLARLRAADALAEGGESIAAADAYRAVAATPGVRPLYGDLARIKAAMALFDVTDPDDLIADLSQASAAGAPYRPLALELLGAAHLKASRRDAAIEVLTEAATLAGAPRAVAARSRELLLALGAPDPLAEIETPSGDVETGAPGG